jgi:hypothetical protein
MPNMPDLLTGPPDDPDSVTLALPDNSSVPPPSMPGVDLSRGVAAAVPGKGGLKGGSKVHTMFLGLGMCPEVLGACFYCYGIGLHGMGGSRRKNSSVPPPSMLGLDLSRGVEQQVNLFSCCLWLLLCQVRGGWGQRSQSASDVLWVGAVS